MIIAIDTIQHGFIWNRYIICSTVCSHVVGEPLGGEYLIENMADRPLPLLCNMIVSFVGLYDSVQI